MSVCVQPLDVVRTRMQADATKNALGGTLQTFQTIIREGGVRFGAATALSCARKHVVEGS